ncbi:hypothetical protein [Methylomarinovum tepidoasis]|uniref:hypothetical protein n=1 Tax=Methylomarinovum tepidoasis TaxID=2840183 RepID=UPI002573FF72|nr:hypothetical protein [Methylomarinovum sp. IN45]
MPSSAAGQAGDAVEPALAAKLALLRDPAAYPDRPARVEVVETHMAWVFLTDRHAYKLKKPLRRPYLDFSTVAARGYYCREEVRLNRPLAPGVYLGVLPLTASGARLALDGDGEIVDWLVWMRRLPGPLMLDRLLQENRLEAWMLPALAAKVAAFHRQCAPVLADGEACRVHYRCWLDANARALQRLRNLWGGWDCRRLLERQRAFLENHRSLFDQRARSGCVIEGHGDLRPEHVCFETRGPQVFDRLEFNRDFRLLDRADEVAYLALECAWLGHAQAGLTFLAHYRRYSGDDWPPALLAFYLAYRATLRGRLLLTRVREEGQGRWLPRAWRYLALAAYYSRRLPD